MLNRSSESWTRFESVKDITTHDMNVNKVYDLIEQGLYENLVLDIGMPEGLFAASLSRLRTQSTGSRSVLWTVYTDM